MNVDSQELKEYVKSVVNSITSGLSETRASNRIREPIEFDIAVTNVSEKEGGVKVYVASIGGKSNAQEVSRIRFKVEVRHHHVPGRDGIPQIQ